MTSHVRHRRTSVAGDPPPGVMEPGELALNLADLQLFMSTGGTAQKAIAVRYWRDTAAYEPDDMVAYNRLLWVANEDIQPGGAFNEAQWTKLNEADVGNQIDDAIDAHVAEADPHTQYATDVDLSNHQNATDPHPQYATDADLAAHVAAANPHAQYMMDSTVPPGAIMMWLHQVAPAGWALMQGGAVSRSANPKLFALWGTNYGAGDGATTFGLPDMRGLFPRGVDAGRGLDAGRALGSTQNPMLGSHTHPVGDAGHGHPVSDPTHAHAVYDPAHSHSGWTDAQGQHNHGNGGPRNIWGLRNENWATFYVRQTNQGADATDDAGAHGHNVGIGASGTGIGIYGAATGITVAAAVSNITVQAAGGAETRPYNMAMNFIVRLG